MWVSDTLVYNWIPVNEFKLINGFKCQKAIAKNGRGEEVTGWFTEDIPYSAGPLNLAGLPGLIMEYYNLTLKRFFKAVTVSSSDIPEQKFRKWLSCPIITKTESVKSFSKDAKKAEQFRRMIDIRMSISKTGDTITFNPGAFALKNEATVEDLLSRLPGMEIRDNGRIFFNGKSVRSVLIEGDDLFKNDYQLLTRNAAPKTIDRIQVIKNYQKINCMNTSLTVQKIQNMNLFM